MAWDLQQQQQQQLCQGMVSLVWDCSSRPHLAAAGACLCHHRLVQLQHQLHQQQQRMPVKTLATPLRETVRALLDGKW
jgi:hypothetical protein